VHGRNLEARNSLFRFLRSIGLRPLEWSQAVNATGQTSPFIGDILDVAFSIAQAIIVLMTPDDVAQLQEQFRSPQDPPYESLLTGQARPNVLFEAGMAMGRNPDRTVLVELGTVRPFSDIAGRHTIKLSNDSAARQELAERLKVAGCSVDLSGRDWHTEGDFNPVNINPTSTGIAPPPPESREGALPPQAVADGREVLSWPKAINKAVAEFKLLHEGLDVLVDSTNTNDTFAYLLVSVWGDTSHLGDYLLNIDKTGEIINIEKQTR